MGSFFATSSLGMSVVSDASGSAYAGLGLLATLNRPMMPASYGQLAALDILAF